MNQHAQLFMLKAFPMPSYIPSMYDVVIHKPSGRRALVITEVREPEDFDINTHELDTRPCICTIILGEDQLDIDVSFLTQDG